MGTSIRLRGDLFGWHIYCSIKVQKNLLTPFQQTVFNVMLECYVTDSQSIHIRGKTIINRALDDTRYILEDS